MQDALDIMATELGSPLIPDTDTNPDISLDEDVLQLEPDIAKSGYCATIVAPHLDGFDYLGSPLFLYLGYWSYWGHDSNPEPGHPACAQACADWATAADAAGYQNSYSEWVLGGAGNGGWCYLETDSFSRPPL